MRLTKEQEAMATQDMLEMLRRHGSHRTSQLIGTRHFHGERTLSLGQVRRLLGAAPEVEKIYGGSGMYTYCVWRLKGERT